MKKTLTIVALILAITISLIAGTMSYYSITIDKLAEGSVVAKEFILMENGEDTFQENVKIAPGETVTWEFSVKNHKDGFVSETAMDLDFNINVAAAKDKDAIEPLTVLVAKVGDTEDAINFEQEGENITFTDKFDLHEQGQAYTYQVTVSWPWETENFDDTLYAGANYGSALTVSVTGTQVPTQTP